MHPENGWVKLIDELLEGSREIRADVKQLRVEVAEFKTSLAAHIAEEEGRAKMAGAVTGGITAIVIAAIVAGIEKILSVVHMGK